MDINQQSENKYILSKWGSSKPVISDVLLVVFTNVNGAVKSGGNREFSRGWTEEGILQFNELCKIIKQDRETHGNTDKELLKKITSTMATKQSRKHAKINQPTIKAYVDCQDDNDSSESSEDSSSENEDSDD